MTTGTGLGNQKFLVQYKNNGRSRVVEIAADTPWDAARQAAQLGDDGPISDIANWSLFSGDFLQKIFVNRAKINARIAGYD